MPYAAPTRCTYIGPPRCKEFAIKRSRCEDHQPSGWTERARKQDQGRSTEQRNDISKTEWQSIWGDVMREHGRICHVCGRGNADQVDHIIAVGLGGARNDRSNLAPIHSEPCHRKKTAAELVEMKRRKNTQNTTDNA